MIEEVAKNIYRIGVVLPENPLKELNSYFIRGEDRDLLIDTGFRCKQCREVLEGGLRELASVPEKRDVLITHIHADHSGMADWFVGPGCRIYISQEDLQCCRRILNGGNVNQQNGRFLQEGFPLSELEYIRTHNPARSELFPRLTTRFAIRLN